MSSLAQTQYSNNPVLDTAQISDIYTRKNFESLQTYFSANNQLLNFNFFELVLTSAVSNYKMAHKLGYVPLDIIVTQCTGVGQVTFNYGLFDSTNVNITTTGACRVRFFAGTYYNYKSSASPKATDAWLINPTPVQGVNTITNTQANQAPTQSTTGTTTSTTASSTTTSSTAKPSITYYMNTAASPGGSSYYFVDFTLLDPAGPKTPQLNVVGVGGNWNTVYTDTWRMVAKTAGYYDVAASLVFGWPNTIIDVYIDICVNGVARKRYFLALGNDGLGGQGWTMPISGTVYCRVGDAISIAFSCTSVVSIATGVPNSWVQITQV